MPKFIISDRIPCWVTWKYEIEAETEEEAEGMFLDGDQGRELGHEIGDSLDYPPSETSIKPAPPERNEDVSPLDWLAGDNKPDASGFTPIDPARWEEMAAQMRKTDKSE